MLLLLFSVLIAGSHAFLVPIRERRPNFEPGFHRFRHRFNSDEQHGFNSDESDEFPLGGGPYNRFHNFLAHGQRGQPLLSPEVEPPFRMFRPRRIKITVRRLSSKEALDRLVIYRNTLNRAVGFLDSIINDLNNTLESTPEPSESPVDTTTLPDATPPAEERIVTSDFASTIMPTTELVDVTQLPEVEKIDSETDQPIKSDDQEPAKEINEPIKAEQNQEQEQSQKAMESTNSGPVEQPEKIEQPIEKDQNDKPINGEKAGQIDSERGIPPGCEKVENSVCSIYNGGIFKKSLFGNGENREREINNLLDDYEEYPKCVEALKPVVCGVVMPWCSEKQVIRKPCASLCYDAKRACENIVTTEGFPLNCDTMRGEENENCFVLDEY